MQLTTSNIGATVADTLRELIIDGTLSDGDNINEKHLSEQLGISRTPLREGLGRLVADKIVTRQARRGFFVAPLTLSEFEQLYDIRPLLDPEALRVAGLPDEGRLEHLNRLNQKLMRTRNASKAIDLDNQWHSELLAGCTNRVLLDFIGEIIVRTRRYEQALFRETKNIWVAGEEHERIIAALRQGDLRKACAALKQNMRSGKAPIVAWLKARAM